MKLLRQLPRPIPSWGERCRRIVKRRGKLKALVAVARSILVIIWNLLSDPTAPDSTTSDLTITPDISTTNAGPLRCHLYPPMNDSRSPWTSSQGPVTHYRVGNNSSRTRRRLGHRTPQKADDKGVGTCILCPPLVLAHRHDPRKRRPALEGKPRTRRKEE